jgi:hypothetical protein
MGGAVRLRVRPSLVLGAVQCRRAGRTRISSHLQALVDDATTPMPYQTTRDRVLLKHSKVGDPGYLALPALHLVKAEVSIGRHRRDPFLWRHGNVLESTREKGLGRTNRTAVCVFKGCS